MKHFIVLCILASSAAARADVTINIRELPTGTVSLAMPSGGTWTLKVGSTAAAPTCNLVAPAVAAPATSTISVTIAACPSLFEASVSTLNSSTVTKGAGAGAVKQKLVVPVAPALLTGSRSTAFWPKEKAKEDLGTATAVVYYSDKKWYSDTPNNFPSADGAADAELVVWADIGGVLKQLKIVKGDPAKKSASYEQTKKQGQQACAEARSSHPEKNVLCFFYATRWERLTDQAGGGTLMRPNTRLFVVAVVPPKSDVTLELSGEIGLVDPKVRDKADGGVQGAFDEGTAPVTLEREWGPPKPGVHTLTVSVKARTADAVADSSKVDITVEEAYAGAIRIGVGAVFGSARDRAFSGQALPGSGQMEITTTDGGVLDSEIVIGAAAFLEEGGRTYFSGKRRHWAPYFGIGVLNQTATGFETLKSLHLGAEYEISKQFSISFTLVGRRVTRLVDGLEVGDPINSATVPTRTGYEVGVGLVINLTPEFLKLGKSPGSGFFK